MKLNLGQYCFHAIRPDHWKFGVIKLEIHQLRYVLVVFSVVLYYLSKVCPLTVSNVVLKTTLFSSKSKFGMNLSFTVIIKQPNRIQHQTGKLKKRLNRLFCMRELDISLVCFGSIRMSACRIITTPYFPILSLCKSSLENLSTEKSWDNRKNLNVKIFPDDLEIG